LGKTVKLLIIDDESIVLECLRIFLKCRKDFEVRGDLDPRNALALVRDFRPDIILLDVVMPYCWGGDLAQMIKQDAIGRSIPILFYSGFSKDLGHIQTLGPADDPVVIIAKPCQLEHLLAAINCVLKEGLSSLARRVQQGEFGCSGEMNF
jgi:two-component system OmpR family response regulator